MVSGGSGARFGPLPKDAILFYKDDGSRGLAREASNLLRQRGRFTENMQLALTDAHYVMARTMQEFMADALDDSIKETGRPQRKDRGRLKRAILDEKNTIIRADRWAVGVEEWLNRSPAGAYWRVIDQGTGPYDTSGLFFADREGTLRSPKSAFTVDLDNGLQRRIPPGGPVEGANDALMLLQIRSGRVPSIRVSGIDARNYQRKGLRRWQASKVRERTYREILPLYGFGDYLKLRGDYRAR